MYILTALPTSSQPATSSKTSALSGGAIAGIVIASSAVFIGVAFIFYKFVISGDSKDVSGSSSANFDSTGNPLSSSSGSSGRKDIMSDL